MKNKYIHELDNIKADSSFKQQMIEKMEKQSDERTIASFTSLNERYIASGGLTYQKEYKTMILEEIQYLNQCQTKEVT